MHLKTKTLLSIVTLAGFALTGCEAKTNNNPGSDMGVTPGADMGTPPPPPGPPPPPPPPNGFAESSKSIVKFKANERLAFDVSQALSIPLNEVCNELGAYSCTGLVHRVSLGGVEPYNLNLNEPLPSTTITTPIAVERVALYACERRAQLDMDDLANATIFTNLPVQDGALSDIEDPAVTAAIDTLYKRVVLRAPTDAEVNHLKGFYQTLVDDNEPNPAKAWATLSCFTVLSTMEALFY